MRPIDADALIKDIENVGKSVMFTSHHERMVHDEKIEFAIDAIEGAPTIEAEPVLKSSYIQQLEAERDAAVRDLNNNWKCAICKRFTKPITDCPHYRECGLAYTFWEWRGVCAENGGIE